jgi:PTS system nitrogen regulatory IIA component
MYLNLIQIAESFGVSERVVESWVRDEEMPHTQDRGRLLFDREQVAEWAAERGLAARTGFLAPEAASLGTDLRLAGLLRKGGIWRDVPDAGAPALYERIVNTMPGATPSVRKLIGQRVRAEGGVTLAPVGGGFALPHPSARVTLGRDSGVVALILLRDGLSPGEASGMAVSRLLFFIAPSPRAHLDLIARLSRLLAQRSLGDLLDGGAQDEKIFQYFDAFDEAFAGGLKPEARP